MLKEWSRFVHVPWAVLVLTRPLFIVAVTLALLVSAGVAHAQGTPTVPTIESVAVTSGPGGDGGYAIADEIQVGLTFSEAVTVTGAPQLTLDVGGRNRTAEYSDGSTTTQLLLTYTVASGDEDTDGIAVVANSLALNGGAIRAGSANATLTHAALHSGDHRVDGIAPTVTVGGEPRTYVPPGRQFNVVFYFSEKVYGITDPEITVTNGLADYVRATSGNATWPKYTRWDVIIVPAAEGPVSVTLEAGAATDAYGNGNTAPVSALEVIAATPVTVEVNRTTSGFAEGGRAEFTVTRSGDNGAIPVSLSVAQTGDFLSGAVEVHPPPDPNNPDDPVTPQEFAFTETPFNLNVTFAAGETSKRIAVPTQDDSRDEDDGTVTLSVPARPDQYKYIPGHASSATADVRDNDEPFEILMTSDSYTPLSPLIEGEIAKYLLVHSRISSGLTAYLEFTEGLELLDLGGAGSRGYEHVSDGRIRVELRGRYTRFSVPTLEDETIGPGGRITLVGQPGDGYLFSEDWINWTYRLSDDDSPPSVTLAAPVHVTEGDEVRYTITRTSDAGQSRAELTVNVQLEQTGDYITWPTAHQPDADGLVTIPVNFAARSLTATLTLDTVDDQMSEDNGSVTATILADADGSYVTGADSGHTTKLLDNDLPVISVAAVSAEVTEGSDAQFTFNRMGNTSGATRVGLWVGGLPKIMTDATEAIALTADNPDLSQRLHIHGAWVDYILEFEAGEAEKTLSFTTEADNVNEGDGWFGVTIVQRAGNLFGIGTGYAQVLVKDDDIPTVSLTRPVGPTGLTLSADGTTWEGQIGEKTEFSYSSVCTGVTEFSEDQGTNLRPLGMWVMYANHPAHYGEGRQDRLGLNFANIRGVGAQNCAGDTVTAGTNQLYVGPENGVLEIELLPESELVARPSSPNTLHLKVFLEFIKKYEEAARAAEAAGTLITQKDIIHPRRLGFVHRGLYCAETDLRYCPKYLVGTVNKIRLTIINRDPTVLIKAENSQVEEGQPARFVVERLWSKDVIGNPAPDSTTVVSLRASQNGQYITGALPTEITFGLNETSKIIELPTVDDSAFGENGSVTIELLPDTTGAGVNLQGKYTTWEIWQGHTPEGARSDRATVAITNNDTKPGITIAPASALEGDSGSADMIFTVTLAKAVAEAVTVNYATSDGTAIAGRDYTAVSNGSVTIAAGDTTAEFTVPVTGDETDELDETFNVTISLPLGATAAAITGGDTAAAVGAILDDDPAVVTVAPKKSPVTEGEEVVFVLTRTGVTDEELYMLVDVEDPARRRLMIAKFDADAVTTELSVATENNDLVDYPSERDYTIHLYGDGYFGGRDDERYTPGDPDEATITVQDNDTLVVVTVEPVKEVVGAGESVQFRFRRTGSIAGALTISFQGFEHPSSGDATFADASVTFLADNDTVVYTNDVTSSGTVNPISRAHTVLIYGDTGRGGLHRSWIAGDPNRATVVVAVDALGPMPVTASYPSRVAAAESVSVEYTVTNLGTRALLGYENRVSDGTRISTTPDRGNCDIRDEIPAGESRTCSASFTVTNQDVTNGKIEFNATARNLHKSSTLRVYIRVAQPVEFGFTTADTLEVTEGPNVTATLPVTRTGRLDEAVTVAYRLRPLGIRPAALGEDFTDPSSTPGLLTFPANVTSANIVINITQDQIDEERERFRVVLVPLTDGTITEGKESRVVLVKDEHQGNDPYRPTASLQLVSSGPVPENEGPVEFAIVLDRVWGKDGRYEVEVLLDQTTATPGFATLGKEGDFEEPLIRILRIPAGQTRFEFSVPLYDDDVREEDETFLLQLTSPYDDSYRTIGTSNRALATIADDDRIPPTEVVLSLSHNGSALESVPEGSTQQDITVTASFPQIRWPGDASNAPLRPADPLDVDTTVRVRFDPNSGAAHAAGLDDFAPLKVEDDQRAFQEVESFDIAIPAGQTSGNATVRFWPVKDDVDEEDETVTLQGSEVVAGGSADSLPVRSASFTIIDDDTRSITVSPSSALIGLSLVEGGEPGTYSLVLDSQPTDTVVITLAGNQGGFLGLVPDTLTFTTSDWATPQAVSVMALDDGIAGGVPPTYFVIHQVSGGDYGSVTVPDISTLIEDTTQAFVYLEGGQASESDGYVEFTVTVRPILRTVPVLVRYATVDGTAMAGSDYTREVETGQTHKILDIPAGQSSGTIRIPITDDQVYESADETFTLQLTNHNNKATLDGGATSLTAAGAIADDDPKPVASVAGPAGDMSYVSENAKDPVTFTLTLIGRSAGDVTVDYATGEAGLLGLLTARQGLAGATQDEDYAGTSGTVTFTPGQTTKTVTVQVTNDDVSEDTEFFGFRISAPQGADLRGQRSEDVADVGLLDDDPRGVAIGPTSISLDEPASGETAVAGAYTVKLSSSPTDTVTVTIGGSDPAVSLSGDTLTNNQLTFTTTNWNTAQTITVTPVKDDNAAGETVTLTHTLSGGDYAGIAADSVTVSLTDSDARNLVLSEESLAVTEGDATGTRYTVELATQPSDTVTVAISGHDGADLTLSGTTLTNNQLTFTTTNWGTAQTVTVKAGDDDNADNESETLAHTASGGDYVNITKDLPVRITDDGDPQVTFVPDTVTREVNENTGANQNVGAPVTATYTGTGTLTYTLGGTDAASFEIESSAGQIKTKSGVSYDHEAKATYTVTVTASDGNGGTATATVTINVNDVTEPPLAPTGLTATAVGHSRIYLSWTAPTDDGGFAITGYRIESSADGITGWADLVADTSSDATTHSHTGLMPNTTRHYRVSAINGDGASDPSDTANATTVDYPRVTVSFGATAYTAAEGRTVDVAVSLDVDPERTVVIPITATPQGTTTTDDYTVPTSVTFDAGDMSKTITFTATQDTDDDDNESVKLTFGMLPSRVSAGTTAETTVSITDDDTPPTAANGTVTTVEDTAHTFAAANFSYSDTDNDPLVSVKIIELPAAGTGALTLNGTAITSANLPKTVTATELIGGGLKYAPPANANGAGYASFKFKVNDGTADSAAEYTITINVTAVNDPATGAPTISGTAQVGQTLTASTGDIADADGLPSAFTYQWKRYAADRTTFEANIGTDSMTYTLTASEEGKKVLVEVSFTDNGGSSEGPLVSVLYPSTQSQTVDPNTPPTASDGTVTTVEDTAYTFAAANFSYSDTDNDPLVSVKIIELPATGAGALTLNGTAITSADLPQTVTAAELTGGGLKYAPPANANGTGYASFKFKLNDGTADSASEYFLTINVTPVNDPATGAPAISGTAHVGLTLTASTAGIADLDGVSNSFTYQWIRVDDDGTSNAANIGADSSAYTLTAAEEGKKVLVEVSFTDNGGSSEGPLASAAYPSSGTVVNLTVSFGETTYMVTENGTISVIVHLSADPERTVAIPITATPQGTTTTDDYTVPTSVTFDAGDMSKTITFTATQDAEDDDGESVLLAFGILPDGVSPGTRNETTVSITDDDVPQVTVSFGQAAYTVAEGETQSVTVTLSADPERTVVIPITHTPQTGADSPADYTVPSSVTFNTGQMSQTITFEAIQDDVDDDDESVRLRFGTLPPAVSLGTTTQATVSITDDDGAGVSVSESSLTIAEGSSGTYTIVLDSQPTADVTVTINDPSNADVTAEPASLTFSSTDWNTPKTVTVNAGQDADAEDETATVTHTVTSSDSSYSGASANSVAVTVTDDEVPVTVSFGATTYEVVEGETVTVTVILSADPERTVVIPITAADQDGAAPADYTVPTSVTVDAGEMSKTIAFTATQDNVDDDDESVKLAIGTTLPSRVTQGATNETTVSITDDDDPQVAVSFDRASYRVLEGDTTTVGVTLSGDPERTVVIPLVATEEGGASSEDYSGVPSSVTINEGETSKTFEFMAMADDASDAGEGVMIGFGTSLPSRVAEGTPNEARVAINQRSTQLGSGAAVSFELDCLLPAAVWCADLGFSDRTAENWGWAYLRYGEGWDPPASLSDEGFRFRGVNYTVRTMELRPGTHPSMPNAWSRWQQGYSHFSIGIFWNHAWGSPSREHYQDWVLHLDGLELPFKEALRHGASFIWVGAEIQEVFNDWTPSTVNMIGIEEVAAADQETNPLLPWAPMQVDAPPQGPNRLLVVWAKPAWYFTGLPAPTKYIVQWKLASASWDNSAVVSEREVAAGSNFHSLTIDGLTEDALYSVRVIAGNDAGNGPPSEETLGRPQDDSPQLIAQTINGDRLTLRFSNRLSTGSVPAGTAFTVLADGGLIEVDSVAIRGNEVVLTLDRAVTAAAHSVKVRYDKPTDPSGVFLRDIGGNHAQIRQHHELLEVVNITPEASVQPLTARFANEPANHNGRDNFTFDIEFSEPVWVAIGFPRDDMLEVAGGTVVSAPWRERRSDAITFHVRPDTMGDIVIVLPGNQVCEGIIEHTDRRIEPVAGAPCAIGNRKLTNSLTMTVPGPLSTAHQVLENTPAQGQPLIEGIPEPGQTLSANTNTITDADGLENTVFRYQWLADDAESNGATGATYTVESGDVSRAIRVRVTFTDDAGHEETLTSAPTVVTAAGLQLGSAAVDGATMKLTYNEELDTGVTLSTTAFAVEVNGSSRSLIGVGVGQSNVLLLLNPAVEAGDTVTVDYTAPDGPDFIRDTRGRKAASFSGQAVTNETASAPLAASVHNVPPSHNGEDAFTFELRFSEDPQPDFSYTTVRDHVFTVTGGSVTYVRRLEPGRNVRWEVTVTPGSEADVALALNATTDCSAQGAICTEDGRMLSGGLQLAVPGPNTPATETPNTPATGLPSITGTAQVGYTITAVTSGIEDADGLDNATFNHQWLADDAEIVGATGGSYILADADEGKTIKVQVSFTDDGDNDEILTSVATAAVAPKPNSPATGAPTISGTTQAGETLTSSITGISDGDGLATATFNYQWLADDADIAGATGSSYTTVAADAGKAIKVRVSFTDDAENDEQLTSAGTGAVAAAPPPPNTPATGLPTISGTAQVGETLTAGTTGISDADGLGNAAFAYQWLADDAEINGATASTYILADADAGKAVKVKVTFTDAADNDEELTSAATGAVAAAPPPPNTPATGLPTISGTAQVGETLTAGTTGISDGDGLDNASFTYQWLADDVEINGATDSTYTLADADAGKAIKVRVSFTDDAENDEQITSAATGAVAAAPPPPNTPATGLPTIAGTAQVGETLTVDTTGISDGDGLDNAAFAYQWLADDVEINGATGSTYTLADADEGKAIKVRVSFTDDAENDEELTSAATGAVAAAPPPPNTLATGLPSISGTAQVGETLTADATGISDADGLDNAAFAYQWLADDVEINGATGSTYTLADADEGKAIKVRVSFTDDAENDEQITSAATGAVAAAPPPPNTPATGLPTITGTAQVGETLTAGTTGISDADGLDNAAFAYQWLADDVEINGATGSTYTLADADEGKAIKVRVSFTDDAGNDEQLTSAGTGAVAAAPPPPNTPATGLPAITGTAQVGETLTVDTTGISDADGLDNAAFAYQWLADDVEINGATASTYTLADADEGKAIKVSVSFTDDAENDEQITSAGTGAVAAAPPPPNTPATGLPTIAGTAQVGETLTADTTGITDGDGLDNAAFAYQWLADDVEINGATGFTYTLADADEGKAIKVRVSFTDDAENGEVVTSAATGTVAAAVVMQPLTASTQSVPSSHDGSATFIFELRFSEELVSDFSYVAMRDHVLTVTGGSVTYVRRLGPPSNIGWEIHVTPDSDGALIIVLPVTGDCGSDGAICTEDGRMLSNRLEFTVNGP